MKWADTIASTCRYGDVAARIFGDADVIYEDSEADYQGHANIFAALPDGTFAHYEWTYGSCSGCDEWEARELDDDTIEAEMRASMAVLKDRETARRYLGLDAETVTGMHYPTANDPRNGSVPGMLRSLTNVRGREFRAMSEAFAAWCAK